MKSESADPEADALTIRPFELFSVGKATTATMIQSAMQGWKLKPKPENQVLKEILETQTKTDTYLTKILKT